MGYIVVCYSHPQTKEWQVATERDAKDIINNHPLKHNITYYEDSFTGNVSRSFYKILDRVRLFTPKRKQL